VNLEKLFIFGLLTVILASIAVVEAAAPQFSIIISLFIAYGAVNLLIARLDLNPSATGRTRIQQQTVVLEKKRAILSRVA
jgi:hypothetical protein